jgi:gamma-glutamylcyclotransferase (GGCT)/AIG2-like uncharacterized protein YtfP
MYVMESLFVYGTLQDAEVQQRIIGRLVAGSPDALDGYRKAQISIGGNFYPFAVQDAADSVRGQVLEVTADELAAMDAYEGDEYRRIQVTLRSGRIVWVYCE